MSKYLLGIDIGSSSVKSAIVNIDTGQTVSLAQSPQEEMAISSPYAGWAEQDPNLWWLHAKASFQSALKKGRG